MLDILMVKKLNEYIDRIIKAEKDDKTKNQSILEESFLIDGEVDKVVDNLSDMDFSSMSKIMDELKSRLLERIISKNNQNCDKDELDIEDLDHVAGGLIDYPNDFEDDKRK